MTGQPRSQRLTLEVERLDDRGTRLRFTSPRMPGWVQVASTPVEVARILHQAWTEADIAGYARWRGSSYDEPDALAAGQPRSVPPRAPVDPVVREAECRRPRSQLPDGAPWGTHSRLLRPDVADPADWTELPDGRLQAPDRGDGRAPLVYRRDTVMAQRVLQRRREAGLPEVA